MKDLLYYQVYYMHHNNLKMVDVAILNQYNLSLIFQGIQKQMPYNYHNHNFHNVNDEYEYNGNRSMDNIFGEEKRRNFT